MKKKRNKKYTPKTLINPYRRFNRGDVVNVQLRHETMFDAIKRGEATAHDLVDMAGAIHLWSILCRDDDRQGQELLSRAHILIESLADRFKRTGRVGMTGAEMNYTARLMTWINEQVEVVPPERLFYALDQSSRVIEKAFL